MAWQDRADPGSPTFGAATMANGRSLRRPECWASLRSAPTYERSLQPARLPEAPVEVKASPHHRGQRGRVAVLPVQFGHVLEVHAPDAGESGRHREDGGPSGQSLVDLAL